MPCNTPAHSSKKNALLLLSTHPRMLVHRYQQFNALLQLSPEAHVAALEAKGADLTLAMMQTEMRAAAAELAALDEALPPGGIAVGVAYVSTSKVQSVFRMAARPADMRRCACAEQAALNRVLHFVTCVVCGSTASCGVLAA
jgi:hypothetical protein